MTTQERPRIEPHRLWAINGTYLAAAVLLLMVEIVIGLRVHDDWIRPHGGDVLVVILLYFLVRAFLNVPVVPTALGVLAFSFAVEVLQYFHFVERLGLQDNRFARVILGSTFGWLDLVSYSVGIGLVLVGEWAVRRWRSPA
jgi:hypothetical protein